MTVKSGDKKRVFKPNGKDGKSKLNMCKKVKK